VSSRRLTPAVSVTALALLLAITGCSRADDDPATTPQPGGSGDTTTSATREESEPAPELHLGYFGNVTHATALIGTNKGFFANELGSDTELTTTTFNAGPEEIGALLGGSIDIGFIGPGPTINGFTESDGEALRLISGATSGGAQLVVRDDIASPEDLIGKIIATPQLGNTQDVAFKKWLSDEGLPRDEGDQSVTVQNIANSDTFAAFQAGDLDGGWLPEPWSSRMVVDAGAKVLVDEADLWDGGQFPTTLIIVRTAFLEQYPSTVEKFLKGQIEAVQWAQDNPDEAKSVVNEELTKISGAPLDQAVIDRAFENIELTFDPTAANFPQLADDAVTAGVADEAVDLKGLIDLGPLNAALAEAGLDPVDDAGLGS
jgi:NitT/TauT family transport system substrate-binding protein